MRKTIALMGIAAVILMASSAVTPTFAAKQPSSGEAQKAKAQAPKPKKESFQECMDRQQAKGLSPNEWGRNCRTRRSK